MIADWPKYGFGRPSSPILGIRALKIQVIERLNQDRTRSHLRQSGIEQAAASAFGYLDELRAVQYDWHSHPYHQLLYAFRGTAHVEVGNAHYFLPPQRAAWISAGTRHRTTLYQVECGSVFLHPRLVSWKVDPIRIIAAPPLLREMVKEAGRWQARDGARDAFRDSFFRTLVHLSREWFEQGMPFWLPRTDDSGLARAINYTLENLSSANAEAAARAAAMSPRSFRRRFSQSLGLPWRDYLTKARLLHSMELLGQARAGVAEVAALVGFESPSAFSKAFYQFTAERPSGYRARVSHGLF